ncbi:MAG: pyrroline-5-carboxylate reductase [Massiliimalia sp.]
MKIGFVGAGNMATAIIKGYISQSTDEIWAYDIDSAKVDSLASMGVKPSQDLAEMANQMDYLFLCVKPQNFTDVLAVLKGHLRPETVIVSIAAGITSSYLKKELGENTKIVRVMPNTPLLLGCGASALSQVEPCGQEEFQFVCHIFQSSGSIAVIPESKMNEIITINGSSPAYLYLIAQYFVEYGEQQGIDSKTALELFANTMTGTAKMILESGRSLDELIAMVSSKGGTTLAGLASLREDQLRQTIFHACDACTKRAYELAK